MTMIWVLMEVAMIVPKGVPVTRLLDQSVAKTTTSGIFATEAECRAAQAKRKNGFTGTACVRVRPMYQG